MRSAHSVRTRPRTPRQAPAGWPGDTNRQVGWQQRRPPWPSSSMTSSLRPATPHGLLGRGKRLGVKEFTPVSCCSSPRQSDPFKNQPENPRFPRRRPPGRLVPFSWLIGPKSPLPSGPFTQPRPPDWLAGGGWTGTSAGAGPPRPPPRTARRWTGGAAACRAGGNEATVAACCGVAVAGSLQALPLLIIHIFSFFWTRREEAATPATSDVSQAG
jgi:hypothetical protein